MGDPLVFEQMAAAVELLLVTRQPRYAWAVTALWAQVTASFDRA